MLTRAPGWAEHDMSYAQWVQGVELLQLCSIEVGPGLWHPAKATAIVEKGDGELPTTLENAIIAVQSCKKSLALVSNLVPIFAKAANTR